ncbi:MAG: efflux RND transporter periplasmic adaptor subunit [Planctomycetes bacterium]|nr:efflux RND transporter periplasmic adaptor subunit [Planctomycetota bacterium]
MNDAPALADHVPQIPSPPIPRHAAPPANTNKKGFAFRLFILFVAFAGGGLGVFGAFIYKRSEPETAPKDTSITVQNGTITIAPSASQWKLLKIENPRPAETRMTDPVPGRVKIDDRLASKVSVPVSGRVRKIFVDLGQTVRKGDPLFSVSSPDLADLNANKEKAALEVEAAKIALERVKAMVEGHALPAKEQLAAEQSLKQAEIGQRLSIAKLEALHVNRDDAEYPNEFVVAAPRDGVIVEKNILGDQFVAPDAAASSMVVADLSSVWVVGELFENDVVEIREGSVTKIASPSRPDLALSGKVDMVSSIVDPIRHTVPIRVRVDNQPQLLRPNAYAKVQFALAPTDSMLEIPASALITDGAKQYIYTESEGKFKKQPVVIGATVNGVSLVLSGVRPADRVVTEGGILLDNLVQTEEK